MRPSEMVFQELSKEGVSDKGHAAGAFATPTLSAVFAMLPDSMQNTAETGCGKSTIVFSRLSKNHRAFCFDDSSAEGSSVSYFQESLTARPENVEFVFGPTQQTLRTYEHPGEYDCVLLDGPHAYPFPDLEYFYFYPHIKTGGFLIVDDVHIATIANLVAFLREDDMWELQTIVATTAVFRRTNAPVFEPLGDGWWTQKFNQRRVPSDHPFYLADATAPEAGANVTLSGSRLSGWLSRLARLLRSGID